MLKFRTPDKVYFKKGCLPVALNELKYELHKKKALIVTDSNLYKKGYTKVLTDHLNEMGIVYSVFSDMDDSTLCAVQKGAEIMRQQEPDVLIAFGGGSVD